MFQNDLHGFSGSISDGWFFEVSSEDIVMIDPEGTRWWLASGMVGICRGEKFARGTPEWVKVLAKFLESEKIIKAEDARRTQVESEKPEKPRNLELDAMYQDWSSNPHSSL